MSDISKPPTRLFNEDLVEKSTAKRPVSKLTQLREAPDPNEKKARFKKERPVKEKPLSRAERRRLEKEAKAEESEALAGSSEESQTSTVAQESSETGFDLPAVEENVEPFNVDLTPESSEATPERSFDEVISDEDVEAVEEDSLFKDEQNPTTGETRLIATRTDLDPAHLAEFAKSDSAKIRAAVAANPSTSLKVLTRLKKDKDVSVVVALIGNPSFPAKLLPSFVGRAKKEESILYALVDREDMPAKLYKQLSKLIPGE